ncbi:MAG: hypothetical protein ACOCUO_02045 [archaeon]
MSDTETKLACLKCRHREDRLSPMLDHLEDVHGITEDRGYDPYGFYETVEIEVGGPGSPSFLSHFETEQ